MKKIGLLLLTVTILGATFVFWNEIKSNAVLIFKIILYSCSMVFIYSKR